jgi:hypothetical protein
LGYAGEEADPLTVGFILEVLSIFSIASSGALLLLRLLNAWHMHRVEKRMTSSVRVLMMEGTVYSVSTVLPLLMVAAE